MNQPARQTKERPQSFYDTVQERIDTTIAVDNLNKMLQGIEVTLQVERSTLFLLNKTIPSLQAVALTVSADTSHNMSDLMLQAAQLGMSEADLFSTPETKQLILQEKVDSPGVIEEAPAPLEVEA